MSRLQLIDPATCAAVPWKNGGGLATDIRVVTGADGTVLWRVGTAEIEKDGPFSDYPDHDRHFAIIAGEGVILDFGEATTRVIRRHKVTSFPGMPAPLARLANGPARAFNLMVARGRFRGSLAVHAANQAPPLPSGETALIHALGGAVSFAADRATVIPAGWSLLVERAEGQRLGAGPDAFAVVASVAPVT